MNATDTSSATTPKLTANVTLEVYSGRPDPSWSLDDAAIKSLRERVAALTTPAPDTQAFEGLGYRGIRVAMTGAEPLRTVAVSRGIVTLESGAEKLRFVDPGREIEL